MVMMNKMVNLQDLCGHGYQHLTCVDIFSITHLCGHGYQHLSDVEQILANQDWKIMYPFGQTFLEMEQAEQNKLASLLSVNAKI